MRPAQIYPAKTLFLKLVYELFQFRLDENI